MASLENALANNIYGIGYTPNYKYDVDGSPLLVYDKSSGSYSIAIDSITLTNDSRITQLAQMIRSTAGQNYIPNASTLAKINALTTKQFQRSGGIESAGNTPATVFRLISTTDTQLQLAYAKFVANPQGFQLAKQGQQALDYQAPSGSGNVFGPGIGGILGEIATASVFLPVIAGFAAQAPIDGAITNSALNSSVSLTPIESTSIDIPIGQTVDTSFDGFGFDGIDNPTPPSFENFNVSSAPITPSGVDYSAFTGDLPSAPVNALPDQIITPNNGSFFSNFNPPLLQKIESTVASGVINKVIGSTQGTRAIAGSSPITNLVPKRTGGSLFGNIFNPNTTIQSDSNPGAIQNKIHQQAAIILFSIIAGFFLIAIALRG